MSSSSAKAAAGAMGSKAARACDGCLRRRARWYCAADDAFLCQACDASVHSANPLARRHERVRLRPTSPLQAGASGPRACRRGDDVVPAWFKRKPRTPRGKSVIGHLLSPRRPVVVPDEASGGGGESSPEEQKLFEGETDEDQELLYSVPVFDPALAEFCSSSPPRHLEGASCCNEDHTILESPTEPAAAAAPSPAVDQFFPDSVVSFGPTDAELMEFAADMEALLGRGLDEGNEEEPFSMEALGLIEPMVDVGGAGGRVKMEADGEARGMFLACGLERGPEPEVSGNMLGIDFDDDYGSPQATPDENAASTGARFLPRSLSLNLNYEAIIDKWEKSPWADGERPDVKLDDCWPHDYSMSVWMMGGVLVGHGTEEVRTPRMKMDGGRDARVSRYREKRRTRLFSKKIRYEVRKLNAEKRPRMKGRFVKRANGVAVATACVA